jgi:hypothetical protein
MLKMDKKLIIIVLIVVAALALLYLSQEIRRTYKKEVLNGLGRVQGADLSLLTESDIQHLPEIVQKYLAYTGVIGKPKVQNYRIVLEAEMKTDPRKPWTPVIFEQYNFLDQPTRLFLVRMNMSGLPVIGLDSYINTKGNMLIKAAGLIKVSDIGGEFMDRAEAATLFNDMCLVAPASLTDPRIEWENIDDLTVKAIFTDGPNRVSAWLYFNDIGQLVNFVTDDRSYTTMDGKNMQVRWSTPVGNYREISGMRISTSGAATWHLPEGDYTYGKIKNIRELEYNLESYK